MLKYIKIENCKGILSTLGQSMIEINFNSILRGGGLLAIIGDNGVGKSTILEFCHPYIQFISRDSKKSTEFSKHFLQGTGRKYLEYIINNEVYTFDIKVNNYKVIGKITKQTKDGTIINLTEDGKIRTYNDVVENLFGPPDVFFKTYFLASNRKKLSELNIKERKTYFLDVLNLTKLGYIRKQISSIDLKLIKEQINQTNKNINLLEKDLDKIKIDLNELRKIEAESKKQDIDNKLIFFKQHNKEKSDLLMLNSDIDKNTLLISQNTRLIEEYTKNIDEHNNYINTSNSDTLIKEKEEITLLNSALESNRIDIIDLQKDSQDIINKKKELDNINSNIEIIKDKINSATKKHTELMEKKYKVENEEKLKTLKLKNANDIIETCSGCDLLERAKEEIKQENKIFEEKLNKINFSNKEFESISNSINILNTDLSANYLGKDTLKGTEEKYKNFKELSLKLIDINSKLNANKSRINNINKEIDKLEKDKEERTFKISELNDKILDLNSQTSKIRKTIETLINNKELILEKIKGYDLSMDESQLLAERDKLVQSLTIIENEKVTYKNIKNKIETLLKEESELKIDYQEYNRLCMAFDDNLGLPAVELKRACLSIETIVNDLLQTIFKDQFKIKFITEGTSKDDFDITVTIKNRPETSLSVLSTGEQIIISIALSLASVIYMQKDSKYMCETMFLDEIDSHLNKDRIKYVFDLIRIAHEQSLCKQTIFITHNVNELGTVPRLELSPKEEKGYKYIIE